MRVYVAMSVCVMPSVYSYRPTVQFQILEILVHINFCEYCMHVYINIDVLEHMHVYIYIYVCVCVCVCACRCVCMCVGVCVCMHTYGMCIYSVHITIYAYIYMYYRVSLRKCLSMRVNMYACMCAYVWVGSVVYWSMELRINFPSLIWLAWKWSRD